MLDTIRHRGPDGEGIYESGRVAMGHRRLSIIDVEGGQQPLCNEDGTVWIVFNGEIYNYKELRSFLLSKGHVFRTQTDTEVIVHLYEEIGVGCLEQLRGMFAFAIWDEKVQTLFLARDRIGIKPLYYHLSDKALIFASEIKALQVDPSVPWEVAPSLIDRFATFLYMPGEETLLQGVRKLAPGSYAVARGNKFEVRQYWDISFDKADQRPSTQDVEADLLRILDGAVESHMIADVPVGVLLSGGVDSTAILSFATKRSGYKLNTYTVGFSGSSVMDERPYARLAAEAYGSNHHDISISAKEFADFLPQYVWHMEEPVCEPPAVALYYVSKLAKRDVKVLLSGEGGDEAFAGYGNYRNLLWLETLKRFMGSGSGLLAGLSKIKLLTQSPRVGKYLALLGAEFPYYYHSRTSNMIEGSGSRLSPFYTQEFSRSVNRSYTLEPLSRLYPSLQDKGIVDQMLYLDTKTWLPDDLLIKADKMTMANSVELRVPLLDHKLLEFAASLPSNLKVRGLTTKFIAKKALRSHVPAAIVKRPKAGFPVPYEGWLRKDLRSMVHDVLFDRTTTNRGYFATPSVRELVARNEMAGGYAKEIFSLLTLELWHRTFLTEPRSVADLNRPLVSTLS
jgi:asparagine synthase (glutamine-hydrolysing)